MVSLRFFARWIAGAAAAGGVAVAAPALGEGAVLSPASAFERRVLAAELDARCSLLSDGARETLHVSLNQARAAAKAGGAPPIALQRHEAAVREQAQATNCAEPTAIAVGQAVQDAFAAWKDMQSVTFTGRHRAWTATRARFAGVPGWLVKQNATGLNGLAIAFGLLQGEDGPALALVFTSALSAQSVRLIMRDPARADMETALRFMALARPTSSDPVLAAAPPAAVTQEFWASSRQAFAYLDAWRAAATADEDVVMLRFGPDATAAFLNLDARDVVVLDIAPAAAADASRQPRRVAFEVGDFAAARHFALFDLSRD